VRQVKEAKLRNSNHLGPQVRTVSTNRSPSASALVSTEVCIQCAYCSAPHYSASCDKVVSPKDRRDVLVKAGKCFNCLRSNHKVKNCLNKHSCHNCQGRHHYSICEVQRENPRSPNSLSVPISHNSDTSVRSSTTKNRARYFYKQLKQWLLIQLLVSFEESAFYLIMAVNVYM